MPEPKNTLVGLAGQNAWHNCAGEAAPRISGKYLPSQLRTQKAGPEPAATGRGGNGAGVAVGCCCVGRPPKRKSSRFSAELASGTSAAATATAINGMRIGLRDECSTGGSLRHMGAATVRAKR